MPTQQLLHLRPSELRPHRSKLALAGGLFVAGLAGTVVGIGLWVRSFDGRIVPNVWIGTVAVGGLAPESARLLVQKAVDDLFDRGLPVALNGGRPATLTLGALVGSDFVEDADTDVDAAVAQAAAIGHGANGVVNAWDLAHTLSSPQVIAVPVTVREPAIRSSLRSLYPRTDVPTENARLVFRYLNGAWTATATDGKPGQSVDVPRLLADVADRLSHLSHAPIDIRINVTQPLADRRIAELAKPAALAALAAAPYAFVYGTGDAAKRFDVTAGLLVQALGPAQDGSLALNPEPIRKALTAFGADFTVASQDARFSVVNGRVTQFVPGVTGVTVDVDTAVAQLNALIAQAPDLAPELKTLPLPTVVVQPDVPTEKANDLGIVSVLGVGTSSYAKSPGNRIKNIANGVKLLNGRLIAPGATFSAIAALGPFTPENGYLSELVIKGDKIVPELGGGLCQIGTTTFRAAMHAGLPIAERHNHSLVVSYYNDPSNNNPGTDATIYDPEPDLKFVNDTGKYILFQAEMDPKTLQLVFTFWGTSDGRAASYTPPIVNRWVPSPPEVDTPSPDLKPGQRTCQAAHPGADASFTYTIVRPDGSKDVQTFDSHYRALPKICLVGQDPNAPPPPAKLVPNDIPVIPD